MRVPDGSDNCRRSVPVKLKRKNDGGFHEIESTATNQDGRYSMRVPDREGPYMAVAPRVAKGSDICSTADKVKPHNH